MLYSASSAHPLPDGEVIFTENKVDPPSRAYLKLWELFTVEGLKPKTGDKVLDLGSSPGGWTWVLDQMGCEVVSVDKAPLAAGLALSNRVKVLNESAFANYLAFVESFYIDLFENLIFKPFIFMYNCFVNLFSFFLRSLLNCAGANIIF